MVKERSDRDLDEMLARSRHSGPALDDMWDKLAPQVLPAPSPWKRWSALVAWLGPLGVAAALVLMVQSGPTAFTPRGGHPPAQTPPLLQATCGTMPANPCRVGQPAFLRAQTLGPGKVFAVMIWEGNAWNTLAVNVPVDPSGTTPVPLRLVPDMADVGHGIRLACFWESDGVTPATLQQLPDHTELTLQVQP